MAAASSVGSCAVISDHEPQGACVHHDELYGIHAAQCSAVQCTANGAMLAWYPWWPARPSPASPDDASAAWAPGMRVSLPLASRPVHSSARDVLAMLHLCMTGRQQRATEVSTGVKVVVQRWCWLQQQAAAVYSAVQAAHGLQGGIASDSCSHESSCAAWVCAHGCRCGRARCCVICKQMWAWCNTTQTYGLSL